MPEYTNAEWLTALRSAEPDAALDALRARLMQGLRYALVARYGVTEADIEDFVQDSLLRILDALDSFRGESRLTTWAQKIAVRTALTELRRRRWQDVPLPDLMPSTDETDALAALATLDTTPEHETIQRQTVALLRQLIAQALTERQRMAMVAVMGQGMPLEEVARRMDTNRNALYKYLLNKLGSCGRSPDRATAGTVRRPARASLPRFIEMIPLQAVARRPRAAQTRAGRAGPHAPGTDRRL